MTEKISLGFYSKNIARAGSALAVIILFGITYLTITQYSNHYRSSILKQTSIFEEEWRSEASVFAYLLKNNFIPQILEATDSLNLNKLGPLISKFKKEVGFSAIENIILVNPNFDVVASSNTYRENIKINKNNVSLKERAYLKSCKEYPEEVHYGEPIIGKISKKLSLPIAAAISTDKEIKGYIILSINLENFSKALSRGNISESLERISFFTNDLPPEASYRNLKDVQNEEMDVMSFLKYNRLIIEMDLLPHEKVFFIYNSKKILYEFLITYAIRISILAISAFICAALYKLYKRHVLIPVANLYDNYHKTQERLNEFLNSKISIPENKKLLEVGNIKDLELFNNQIASKLEDYYLISKRREEAVQLALSCMGITLELLEKNSHILNEAIETSIDDLRTRQTSIPDSSFLRYLSDIYNISDKGIEIIELFRDAVFDVGDSIKNGKEILSLRSIIEHVIFNHREDAEDRNLTLSFIDNTPPAPNRIFAYSRPFNRTLGAIISYYIDACNYSKEESYDLVVELEYSQDKDELIINFRFDHYRNISDYSEEILLKAKIHALFNSGIITEEFNTRFHMVSAVFIGITAQKDNYLLEKQKRS